MLTARDLAAPAAGANAPAGHGNGAASGLTVVGSHTDPTSRQLAVALRWHRLTTVEIDVAMVTGADGVGAPDGAEKAVAHAVPRLEAALARGPAALVTSRAVRAAANDPRRSLAIARRVSDAVCAVVARLPRRLPLRYVVAKGGITSHEVAVRGLGMREATVLGQVFPGQVSVLRLGEGTRRPGLPYVIFPGNVGTDDSLARVLSLLEGEPS